MGSDASEPVVKVEKLSQRYGKAVALDDISLNIPGGKMIGLIGPDGVGKSTFDASLASLAVRGTLALFGASSGPVPPASTTTRPSSARGW